MSYSARMCDASISSILFSLSEWLTKPISFFGARVCCSAAAAHGTSGLRFMAGVCHKTCHHFIKEQLQPALIWPKRRQAHFMTASCGVVKMKTQQWKTEQQVSCLASQFHFCCEDDLSLRYLHSLPLFGATVRRWETAHLSKMILMVRQIWT